MGVVLLGNRNEKTRYFFVCCLFAVAIKKRGLFQIDVLEAITISSFNHYNEKKKEGYITNDVIPVVCPVQAAVKLQ